MNKQDMPDPYPVIPVSQALDAEVTVPGSKSITNRALILAALAQGDTTLKGALFSRDTAIMWTALIELGFEIHLNEAAQTIRIVGEGGRIPRDRASIDVGNSGTAARFLTAFLALNPGGEYVLDGDAAMHQRPIAGLLDALVEMGAAEFVFHGQKNHFPFTLRAKGYSDTEIRVEAESSSQILSALLLSTSAGASVRLISPNVRPHYVAMTLKMREAFGAGAIEPEESGIYDLTQSTYKPPEQGTYSIEPDISAACYFLALTLIHGGQLTIPHLNDDPLQGDAHFVEVLSYHGLRTDIRDNKWIATCKDPTAIQRGNREIDFNSISDTFLTYAAIAPLLGGSTRITGIGHTRHQETDRIAGMAAELSKLGQLVKAEDDALTIQPKPNELRTRVFQARNSGRLPEIDTYEDHRFAMSFGVLASYDLLGDGQPWLSIKNPNCCGKTFPEFFKTYESLRND